MIWNAPSFWLLVVLMVGIYAMAWPAQKRLREAEKALNADDLKTFRDHYRKPTAQADMPTKYHEIATAQKYLSKIWLTGCAAFIGALVWIIFAGPSLGLF